MASYQAYLEPLDYVWSNNRQMAIMQQASIEGYLETQKQALTRFFPSLGDAGFDSAQPAFSPPAV